MMIAKMLLLVCVSSSRTVIKTDKTDDADNEEKFHLSVNSAGHVQPSTHSSEVSLHQSLIQESKPAAATSSPLRNFSESAETPAALGQFATQFCVALPRAVFGGRPPTAPAQYNDAKGMIAQMVRLRSSEGKANLFVDDYSESLFRKYGGAWPVVNRMSAGLPEFFLETSIFIAMRTHFIDQHVDAAAGSQIVFLGMELDTRALRFGQLGKTKKEDVIEVGKGVGLYMKVDATTGGNGEYPANFVAADDVAGYIDALTTSGFVKSYTAPLLFVWESGANYVDPKVTAELLAAIFDGFPKARVVFDSIEPGVASSNFLAEVAKALGKPEIFPGKFAMQDMVPMVSDTLGKQVQVDSVAATDYAEQVAPDEALYSYFPQCKDVIEFYKVFQHALFNVMYLAQ